MIHQARSRNNHAVNGLNTIHEAMLYVDGLGAERLIHARLGDEPLVIRLDASKSWPQIGDTVSLKVPDTKKHWFDAATGRRLARV